MRKYCARDTSSGRSGNFEECRSACSSTEPITPDRKSPMGPTSPPNVTVLQPSASHAMFSYLHPSGGAYPSPASSLPYPLGPPGMYGPSLPHGPMGPFPVLPSSSTGSTTDLAHLPSVRSQSSALSPHLLLGGMPLPGGAHLLPQSYPLGGPDSVSITSVPQIVPPSLGPLFSSRPNHRFSPYALPLTKTTMVTTAAPLPSTGSRMGVSHPALSGLSSPPGSGSPGHRTSPLISRGSGQNCFPPTTGNSELKSIERLLNGLEGQRDQVNERSPVKHTER